MNVSAGAGAPATETREVARMSTVEARTIEGVELPPAGTYTFDPAHTTVEFIGKHMFTKTRGRFTKAEGTIVIGETPETSSVAVTIDAASIQSNSEQRDGHLVSADFLNVERWPNVTFRSTGFRHTGGTNFELDGELTIKDITNPITLKGRYLGTGTNPFGKVSAGFTATASFEREDYDMTWNMALEAGGWLVGKTVTVEVEVEAIKED
jgi:polyisoprenoid-binding protein YceI